jgi:integrase
MAGKRRGHGEGTITQRRDGRWEARISLPGGKRRALYGKTRGAVRDKLTAALRDVQQGLPLVGERQTVGQFLDNWLQHVVRDGVRPRTHEAYALNVRRLAPYLASVRLAALTPDAIQSAYAALLAQGLARRTVEQAHTVLHTALRYAVRARLLVYNPVDAVVAPRPVRAEMQILDVQQVQRLFESSSADRHHALWVILATCGLRLGEASGLCWDDIDFVAGTLTIRRALQRQRGKGLVLAEPKTPRSRRTLRLPANVLEALRQHRVRQAETRLAAGPAWQDRGLVFPNLFGRPQDPARVNEAFHRALAQAQLPRRRVHDLRHSCATLHLQNGAPTHEVAAILGHSQASTTHNIYAHATASGQAEALQRLDALLAAR